MPLVAFDTETHLITDTELAPPLVCGSAAYEDGHTELLDRADTLRLFDELIRDPEVIIVGANFAFDICVLIRAGADVEAILAAYEDDRIWDVQIAQALDAIYHGHLGLNPDKTPLRMVEGKVTNRYSLWQCVRLVLGRTDAKDNNEWHSRYAELEGKPIAHWPPAAKQYPQDDAHNTLEVALRQLETHQNLEDVGLQCRAALAARLGAMIGLCVDTDAVTTVESRESARMQGLLAELQQCKLLRPDGSKNTKAIKRALLVSEDCDECYDCSGTGIGECYDRTGVINKKSCRKCDGIGYTPNQSTKRTDGDNISTDRETLTSSQSPQLHKLARLGETEKLLKTYIPWLRKTPTIHPNPNVLLESGRMSYSGLVQQLPRRGGVRECLVPSPGNVLITADYSQLELLCWAQVCLWLGLKSAMADALLSGRDLHTELASTLVQLPYEDLLRLVKDKEPQALELRQKAKACNFGFPGGMGPVRFVVAQRAAGLVLCSGEHDECDLDPRIGVCRHCHEIAVRLRRAWFERWLEAVDYFDRVQAMIELPGHEGRIGQLLGPDKVHRIRGGVSFTQACNTLFQGLAADGAKHAFWRLTAAYGRGKLAACPIAFVHDEVVLQGQPEALEGVRAIMIEAMGDYLPDLRPAIKVEVKSMDRWRK